MMREQLKNLFCRIYDKLAISGFTHYDFAVITSKSCFIGNKFHGTIIHFSNEDDEFIEQATITLSFMKGQ